MNFDMNTVWSRAITLIGDNFQLLLVISAVFLLLPTVAIYLLIPDFQAFADPSADPEIVLERMSEIAGPLIGFGLISVIFQFAGYAAMVGLMGDERPTVGQAIGTGIKAVPSLFVVMIAFAVLYFLGGLLMMLPFVFIGGAIGAPAIGVIGGLFVLVYVIWLLARLSMTMPSLVLTGSLNPFKAISNSFSLTGPKQWAIMLFWFVLFLVFFIVSLLFNGIFGVIAALFGSGITGTLISGLANGVTTMASAMITCGIAVAMFSQLAGPSVSSIEDTFE